MSDQTAARKSTPYWWEAAPVRDVPVSPLAPVIDVLIVGAGYAGISAGLSLARAGRSVAAFDAMAPGEGASSRNGGITSANIRLSHAVIARRFGEEKVLAIEAEAKTAREFLRDLIEAEGLDCDYAMTGRFAGCIGFEQYDTNARAAEALAKRLKIDAFAVPHAEQHGYIGSDFYRGGTVRMDIGGLHPAKFHAELLRVAQDAGLVVHSRTRVERITRDGRGFVVDTSAGSVRAGQVLVCTNGYTDGASPYLRRRMIPVRSRIIATEPLASEVMARLTPKRMMMSEGRILGHYFRPSPDNTRILLGGRDSSRKGDPVEPTLRLREGLARIFPELEGVGLSHSWYGNVAMHRDMLPRIFEKDGIVFATGFCGSGVVWAPWIGSRAAAKLLGDAGAARTAFDFRPPAAIPLYRGDPYFMPPLIQYYRMRDSLALSRASR